MSYYRNIREYLEALERRELLYRVTLPINKDTELMPLVRWQFRGLEEKQRRGWLFERVVDAKGREYPGRKVAIGILGASTAVYAAAMDCTVDEIWDKYASGIRNPITPAIVASGPVKERVHGYSELAEEGRGLEEFPIPISTPGFDAAPYFTAACWITKDPDTGIRNMGVYRAMLKGPTRTGLLAHPGQHIGIHVRRAKEKGWNKLPAALVVGGPPVIAIAANAKLAYGVDELAVAGGIAGYSIPLVRCESVDLEVPAEAEIVVEGYIDLEYLEPEGPFGEYTGYMAQQVMNHVFEVTCITHRKDPIYHGFISQFPPSESSKLRQLSFESTYYKFLKYDANIPGIKRVAFHQMGGSVQFVVISLKKDNPAQAWQALNAAAAFESWVGKFIIAVDEDVDPADPEAVIWALSFACMPHRDLRITMGKMSNLDPAAVPPGEPYREMRFPPPSGTSAVLIDATRKTGYPPLSLPRREFMERARELWEQLGLPALKPRSPWYGYELGYWPEELRQAALGAVSGDYRQYTSTLPERRMRFEAKEGVT